jgi:hypothetical protein
MSERQNTIVFTFDPKSPRISAFDIHEWIYEHLHLPGRYIKMAQIDGLRRQMYIKFVDFQRLQDILHLTNGQLEYRHGNGEISLVRIELAATSTKRVRIASLPPEVPDEFVRTALLRYGKVKEIQEESWSKAYRYSVANGIRIVVIALAKHIPSHMTMAGNRVLVSYEGHPMTCHDCNETGHLYQVCPNRRKAGGTAPTAPSTLWADIAAKGMRSQFLVLYGYGEEEEARNGDQTRQAIRTQAEQRAASHSEEKQKTCRNSS